MNLSDASYLENGDENANHSFCSRKQTEMFLIRLLSASALSSVKYNVRLSFLGGAKNYLSDNLIYVKNK